MTVEHQIHPGQVWADNDRRSEGRTLRVEKLHHAWQGQLFRVTCTVLTGRGGAAVPKPRETHIATDRMRPTSTGYRLVSCPGCPVCRRAA